MSYTKIDDMKYSEGEPPTPVVGEFETVYKDLREGLDICHEGITSIITKLELVLSDELPEESVASPSKAYSSRACIELNALYNNLEHLSHRLRQLHTRINF